MRLLVDLTVPEDTDPIKVADWIMDVLCDPPEAALRSCPYDSCDAVEPA
jgi:hypothetical protein